MSWTSELERVYDVLCKDVNSGILPLYHSTANAQIEISISENGEFKTARRVEKGTGSKAENAVGNDDPLTIIPVTEASGARTNTIAPMPFADKLVYIAGDYSIYTDEKNSDNSNYFSSYMQQLKKWRDSRHSNASVEAVYLYLEKAEVMSDLIKSGVLKTDENTGKLLSNEKISGIKQCNAFVRFIVSGEKTWLDKKMYESFIALNSESNDNKQLCYALGKELVPTYKHPSKIRNAGDQCKLISSNDESGFTYRGRFGSKEEAFSVSYEFSQKIHNALKWLVSKNGISIKGLTLIVWAETLSIVPEITEAPRYDFESFDDDEADDETIQKAMNTDFDVSLRKYLFGHEAKFTANTKVMIMALDSATPGRLSVSLYSEIESTRFYKNVEKWHNDISWQCFFGKLKSYEKSSFSIKTIARCAYGTEQVKSIECTDDIIKKITLQLIPCIAEGKKVSRDIVYALFRKASNPLAYSERYNHRAVVETACGMIKKYYIDHKNTEGEKLMSYDPNNTDRSYLFGCLLAVADKLERATFDRERDSNRETNARRYWSAFVSRPSYIWQKIEENLLPYKSKLKPGSRVYYERCIDEIMDRFTGEDFTDSRGLEPMYLLGYHHYTMILNSYSRKNEEDK